MKTKKIIAAVITVIILFGDVNMAYAKDIPDYYSKFTGTWAYEEYGFEFYSLAFRLKAGEVYGVPSRLSDGTSVKFYYVCDGNSNMRLSTPGGEVITREEWDSYFTAKPQEQSNTTPNTITTPTAVEKSDNSTTPTALEVWNDGEYVISEYELEVIRLVNEERVKAGLNSLTANTELCKLARIRTNEMVELHYYSHVSPVYGKLADMAKKFGFTKGVGENITIGQGAEAAVNSWLLSQKGHRENMLNPNYKEIGVGFTSTGIFEDSGVWSLLLMK